MAASLRILHSYKVYKPDLNGGIPSVIATLGSLSDDDIENEILVARNKGWSRVLDVDGIPVEAVTSFGTVFSTPLAPTYPFALLRRAKRCNVVVHHAPFPLADLSAYRLPKDVALVVYWHADIVGFPFLRRMIGPALQQTLKRADRIVVADRSTIDGSPVLPPFASKCSVIPYGIDLDYWSTCNAEERTESERLRKIYPKMILAIGRLVPYKGFAVLLQALKQIEGQAVLIGDGPLENDLRKLADENGVSDRVHFAGRLSDSDVKAYLYAARVLAFPSITKAEAFGIVQLQALSAGLPIVNTALESAVPHVARHDQEALTVPPNDPDALASALQRILGEPSLAARLGSAGQMRARTEYGRDKYVSRMKDMYRSVVRGKLP